MAEWGAGILAALIVAATTWGSARWVDRWLRRRALAAERWQAAQDTANAVKKHFRFRHLVLSSMLDVELNERRWEEFCAAIDHAIVEFSEVEAAIKLDLLDPSARFVPFDPVGTARVADRALRRVANLIRRRDRWLITGPNDPGVAGRWVSDDLAEMHGVLFDARGPVEVAIDNARRAAEQFRPPPRRRMSRSARQAVLKVCGALPW